MPRNEKNTHIAVGHKGHGHTALAADLSLLIVAVIWGTGFIASQMAIDSGMRFGQILLLRFSLATVLVAIPFRRELKHFSKEELRFGGLAGLFLFLSFYTQTAGLNFTTPSNNAFLTSSNVVMVPFLSWFIFCKRPPARLIVCAALCFGGMAVLSLQPGQGFVLNVGDLLTLLCAFLFACHIISVGVGATRMRYQKLFFLQMLTAAFLSLVCFLAFDAGRTIPGALAAGLPAALYLGVFSTCISFFLQTKAQEKVSPSKTAIILSTESLFGSLFSILLGYELPTWNLLTGGLLIVASVLLTELRRPLLRQK